MAKKIPNPIDTHVGSRVRMRRLILSMSQEKLADAIGLTFQQVQKYEKGTNRMGSSRLQQIANVLKVPVTFFFEGTPGQSKLDGKAQSPVFGIQFPCHVRWTRAHESIHANQERQATAEHRKNC